MSRDIKYIGMDVHKEAIVIAVLNGSGKLVMESIVETKASSILQFIHGLRGELHVKWEERTWAAWLYDLLQSQVAQVLVCDPRRNALLKEGNKSDKVDARKVADLLRTGMLRPVYHGEHGLRTLRELARSYQTISQDLNRVMNRIKALYRGWSIPGVRRTFADHSSPRGNLCGQPESRVRARPHRAALQRINNSKHLTDADKVQIKNFYLEHFVAPDARSIVENHSRENRQRRTKIRDIKYPHPQRPLARGLFSSW